ncbi:hypothetical protein [Streptomyces adustus]|uniref:hypothetical protein n=1 Tax=Streptomyces adustus TaxID=1609272 RepID=UPI003720A84F
MARERSFGAFPAGAAAGPGAAHQVGVRAGPPAAAPSRRDTGRAGVVPAPGGGRRPIVPTGSGGIRGADADAMARMIIALAQGLAARTVLVEEMPSEILRDGLRASMSMRDPHAEA